MAHPFPKFPPEPPDPQDAELEALLYTPRPGHSQYRDADLFAWWAASAEKAYNVAKSRASARLHGHKVTYTDKAGEDPFSAAIGRLKLLEALCPEFFNAWVSDDDTRRKVKASPEEWSHARLIRETAEQDARDELRREVLLMALAQGEVMAPDEEREAA